MNSVQHELGLSFINVDAVPGRLKKLASTVNFLSNSMLHTFISDSFLVRTIQQFGNKS